MYHLVLFTFCGRVISQLELLLHDSGRKYGFSCQNIFFPFLHHGSRYCMCATFVHSDEMIVIYGTTAIGIGQGHYATAIEWLIPRVYRNQTFFHD